MSQSVAANSIVKSLSDLSTAADKIIEVKPSEFVPRHMSEWVQIIKDKALSIAEENENDEVMEEIPTLMSVLKGKNEKRERSRARASAMFTEMQRMHLHPRKGENVKARKSRVSLKTPLLRKFSGVRNSLGSGTPKLKVTPTIIKKVGNVFVASSSGKKGKNISSKETTSVNGKDVMETQTRSSSKRKSTEIIPASNTKNAKIDANQPSISQGEKDRKNPPIERVGEGAKRELMKAKDPSPPLHYSSMKSANMSGVSLVKKDGRTLRSKMETKQDSAAENRRNLMGLQQQKSDQNKKIREEKAMQQKLLKQKLLVYKEPTPKPINKTAGGKSGTPREASNSALKNQKTPQKKVLEAKKTKTGPVSKNNEMKDPKNIKKTLNSTYIASDEASTSSKGKILKKVNTHTEAMKDISNENKTKDKNATKSAKPPMKETSESYAITPARSSFVSYDISEIRSDSEDEETDTNSKPIPSWATGVRLRNALLQQHHHPIDTDSLFGNIFPPPNLVAIMGVNKKQYHKRTSSAVWSSFS